MSLKKQVILLFVVLVYFSNSSVVYGQEEDAIPDLYEYANREWLDQTILPENISVVNNWGILWNEIIDKSIEILSGETKYNLSDDHQYILVQLQNFYKSTAGYSDNERKRVKLIQKHYPLLFGVVFSKITIPSEKEEKIKELIKYLSLAYQTKIETSDKIGNNADFFLAKLEKMTFVIGAPDISNIQTMPILSTDSFENNIQLSEEYQLAIKKDKPVWSSPPFETDCRYNIQENKVKIYAGTLYASNFTQENEHAKLFATIGRTIAHEMTHAFDKSRKKFNKKDWVNINQSLVNQFNHYEIQEGYFVDGKMTLQENFADLGGLEVSLLALKLFMRDNYPQQSSEEQAKAIKDYFVNNAQFWREKASSEFQISSLKRLHTPQKFRAIGPIYNQDECYEVFEIEQQSKYFIPRDSRTSIW